MGDHRGNGRMRRVGKPTGQQGLLVRSLYVDEKMTYLGQQRKVHGQPRFPIGIGGNRQDGRRRVGIEQRRRRGRVGAKRSGLGLRTPATHRGRGRGGIRSVIRADVGDVPAGG